MQKHYPKNNDLKLGARVVSADGTTYTRFASRGQADWITPTGKQYQHLPATDYTVEYAPKKDDIEAAFNVTPAFSTGGVGFGIVAHSNIQPGDYIFTDGFIAATCWGVASTQWQTIKQFGGKTIERLEVTTTRGRKFYADEINYVARNFGPSFDDYVAQ